MNQEHIRSTGARSRSWMDYSLNNNARSIFAKDLYIGQDAKGVFRRVDDPNVLAEVRRLGHTLFMDPLLSGNNERSCASCHRPEMCFTDTVLVTPIAFDHKGSLPRNAPSLVNADLNHLLMQDGRHIALQTQAHAVLTAPTEMGAEPNTTLKKVMDCPEYRQAFSALLRHTYATRGVDGPPAVGHHAVLLLAQRVCLHVRRCDEPCHHCGRCCPPRLQPVHEQGTMCYVPFRSAFQWCEAPLHRFGVRGDRCAGGPGLRHAQ